LQKKNYKKSHVKKHQTSANLLLASSQEILIRIMEPSIFISGANEMLLELQNIIKIVNKYSTALLLLLLRSSAILYSEDS
jgi:hypothetical protein